MKKSLLVLLPFTVLGLVACGGNADNGNSSSKAPDSSTASASSETEIALGSSVLGNWGYRSKTGKSLTDKNQKVEVYVDSETKFHFTITQYYENFAPSIWTYEGQITGITSGVGNCFVVFSNAYLSHGAVSETATAAASAQFTAYKATIADKYEGESQFQITFHRLANDVYNNGYITVDNEEMDISFGVFDAVDKAATTTSNAYQADIALGSSVLGNWGYQTAAGSEYTAGHQKIEVYVDSETKFHFTAKQYYNDFAPSLFTYEGQITGITSGVGNCFAVFVNAYLTHGAVTEAATTAAKTQWTTYKATIADKYEGESQFQITFHRLANDVYNNGYITVDNAEMDVCFGVFAAVDSAAA